MQAEEMGQGKLNNKSKPKPQVKWQRGDQVSRFPALSVLIYTLTQSFAGLGELSYQNQQD